MSATWWRLLTIVTRSKLESWNGICSASPSTGSTPSGACSSSGRDGSSATALASSGTSCAESSAGPAATSSARSSGCRRHSSMNAVQSLFWAASTYRSAVLSNLLSDIRERLLPGCDSAGRLLLGQHIDQPLDLGSAGAGGLGDLVGAHPRRRVVGPQLGDQSEQLVGRLAVATQVPQTRARPARRHAVGH